MKTKSSTAFIGIDLGDRKHAVCVLGADGEIVRERFITNSRGSLERMSESYPGAVMVMEVGPLRREPAPSDPPRERGASEGCCSKA